MCAPVCDGTSTEYSGQGKKYPLLVKIQADSSSFYIAKSQCDNQIALSLTNVKEKGLIFFTIVPCILILSKFFYLLTDAQEKCFKKNIKIYIKTAPTCFGAITIIRERIIRAC